MEVIYEFYTERAAVFEYEAKLFRSESELLAMLSVKIKFGQQVQAEFQKWLNAKKAA